GNILGVVVLVVLAPVASAIRVGFSVSLPVTSAFVEFTHDPVARTVASFDGGYYNPDANGWTSVYWAALDSDGVEIAASGWIPAYSGQWTYPAAAAIIRVQARNLSKDYYSATAAALYLSADPQIVTVTPAAVTIVQGESVGFTAAGGENGYIWDWDGDGETGGFSSTGATGVFTAGNANGVFQVFVYSPAGNGFEQSNTATAVIAVVAP